MGVHYADNAWWLDVLEWGPRSAYADSFDIDWDMLPFRNNRGCCFRFWDRPYGELADARRDRTEV